MDFEKLLDKTSKIGVKIAAVLLLILLFKHLIIN